MLALLACGTVWLGSAGPAYADGRYGDSTWVAPSTMFDPQSPPGEPRVALPDHPRYWETALRTPFRVIFLPFRLLGRGVEAGGSYIGPRYFEPKAPRPPASGPTLGPYVTVGSASDIGVGPAVNWAAFPVKGARLHLAGSWSRIDRRRVHFSETIGDLRPVGVRLGADYDYKPNRHYYGIGNNTTDGDLSYFLLETTTADLALRFGASPTRQLRIAGGYSGMSPRRGYGGTPLLEDVFTPADTPFEGRTTEELWYGGTLELAALDDGRDPSRGVRGFVDLRHASGLHSNDPDYNQWLLEGRAYLPVFAQRRVLAVRGVYSGVDPGSGTGSDMPFYRLAESDHATQFAAYASEHFRDRQLLLGRIEYRWLVLYRLSAVALYELGEVAPSAGAFTLRDAHRSIGGGLRFGLNEARALRLEAASGSEGLHVVLAAGGSF